MSLNSADPGVQRDVCHLAPTESGPKHLQCPFLRCHLRSSVRHLPRDVHALGTLLRSGPNGVRDIIHMRRFSGPVVPEVRTLNAHDVQIIIYVIMQKNAHTSLKRTCRFVFDRMVYYFTHAVASQHIICQCKATAVNNDAGRVVMDGRQMRPSDHGVY